ncbi:MAG TPA: hypothetical protein VJ867_08455 [Gemmatimonadaceae bacterium]|nr:hypothetical protein [Gemmatimonadaceae bacterium]
MHPSSITLVPLGVAFVGTLSVCVAIYHERRMHRHRQPGVTYARATFRRDGGWRRTDLFTAQGLEHQRHASRFGVAGAALWIVALIVWAVLARV